MVFLSVFSDLPLEISMVIHRYVVGQTEYEQRILGLLHHMNQLWTARGPFG